MNTAVDMQATELAAPQLKAAVWLWRPWYAKAWWAAIPVWWIGMAASTKVAPLEAFYDNAPAGFLNVLFFPMTALMVLGVGRAQHWLAGFASKGEGGPLCDEAPVTIANVWEEHDRAMKDLRAGTDMFDPRSGTLWIGNPISPNNGARISVF
ncbi:hypothetical protein KFK14_07360 [Sphingobium phenoxybenzoativorans]|jgi:hypothetical protein|uniref:Uncharacterized protein n=1 Tax=Sphingobium phenoxybenzoativorans TaxID=1592790 RepID=A0A975K9G1_9SPHN|nr:hypothetical protein [Sphingobium phenoxybenzoativorans]QUT07220.1 hypothetical protein KFK14_07360 [Sphingobium phenoxybenzoativorans]